MNKFIFHPVGQGLFYTGDIGKFKFAYDCGSTSSLHGIKGITMIDEPALFKSIDNYYKKSYKKHLDFLVISHLDSDHVNGIPELLSKFTTSKVFLPYFQPIMYKSLVFEAYLYLNDISSQMVNYLINAYKESEVFEELNISETEESRTTSYHLVKGHGRVSTNDWMFVFMNNPLNITQATITLLENDIQNLLSSYKYTDLTIAMTNNSFINDLKKIYKSRFGINNLNQTSTILLHYPRIVDCSEIYYESYCGCDACRSCSYSTLLTGDINLKGLSDLATRVNDEIKRSQLNMLVCSLTHHGSYDNFQSFVSNINFQQSDLVMSYGIKNPWPKYFPNYKTISEVAKIDNRLIYVNEFKYFEYCI